MKIGFHIPRDNHIKFYGPLVDYLLAKGWSVTIFCDHRAKPSKLGYKAYTYPYTHKIPSFKSDVSIQSFQSVENFAQMIEAERIKVVFFVNFNQICKDLKNILRKKGYYFIAAELQYFFELLLTGKDLSYTDIIYTLSKNWNIWWKDYCKELDLRIGDQQADILKEIDRKCVPVGFPEADQCSDFNVSVIKKKYDIPENKKIILLLPFPWRIPFDAWTHIVYQPSPAIFKYIRLLLHGALRYIPDVKNRIDDLSLTESIKAFAANNDAVFIVKGRLKNKVPNYLRELADKVVFDEGFYPFTTIELLFISDLSISFYSASIMESVLVRTPTICLAPKGGSYWPGYDDRHNFRSFSPDPYSFYNYDGIVYYQTVDKFISNFVNQTFDDFRLNDNNCNKFIEKYLGFDDYNASERIYKDLVLRMKNL
jgi:hypothetical protein